LWQFRGKLVVIATPDRPGYHYAQRPTDFIPIIEHLQYLHDAHNIVHGDIRASNMVFSTKHCRHHKLHQVPASSLTGLNDRVNNQIVTKRTAKKSTKKELLSKMACTVMTTIKSSAMTTIKDVLSTRTPLMRSMSSIDIPIDLTTLINDKRIIFDTTQGCPIDFDFGGLHGTSTTRYPTGYNRFVLDGYRIGQEHQMIQYKDDWYALIMVFSQVNAFTPPSMITENDTDSPFYKDIHQSILKQVENTAFRFCSIIRDEHCSNDTEKVHAKDVAKLKWLLIDMEAFGYSVSQRFA
jgi:serine/threonine protein kinase